MNCVYSNIWCLRRSLLYKALYPRTARFQMITFMSLHVHVQSLSISMLDQNHQRYKLECQTYDTHTQKKQVQIKLWLQTGQKSNTVATSTRLVRPSLSSPPAVKIFPLGSRQQVQSSRSVGKSSTLFHTFFS